MVGTTLTIEREIEGTWNTQDRVSRYDIIACVCTLTSGRVGCGCTVRSFTTHGEWGLSCL